MIRRLAKLYKILLVLALIPALVLLGLRFGLPHLSRYSDQIAAHLSSSLGVTIRFGEFHASLSNQHLQLRIEDLTVLSSSPNAPTVSLQAEHLEMTLDVVQSLIQFMPVFSVAELRDADLLWQEYEGRWLPSAAEEINDGEGNAGSGKFLAFLQHQPSVVLSNLHVGLQPQNGEIQLISPINAMFEAAQGEYQISGSARMPRIGEDAYAVFALQASEFDPADPLGGDYRFFLQSDALGPELLNLGVLPVAMDDLDLSAHLWGSWSDHQLKELQGDFSVTPLSISGPQWPEIDNLKGRFVLLPLADDSYQLQFRALQASVQGVPLVLPELISEFRLVADQGIEPLHFTLDSLDLAALHYWVEMLEVLPDAAEQVLDRLAPEGQVSKLVVGWENPQDWLSFVLTARLDDVAVSAWQDAPEASGINGQLHASLTTGQIELESAAFTLNFPQLFGSGWNYSEASGLVSWQVTGEALRLNSGLLSLRNDAISANGRFGLYRPFDSEEQIEFSLLIGITDADALQTEFYTPPRELGETLYDWLKEAIRAGQVNQAGLLIHAGLRPDSQHLPVSVQLFLDADQAEFSFHPDWPVVRDGRIFLHLRNTELRIDIAEGNILNSRINSGWIYLPPQSQQLHVASLLEGDASDFSALLTESALGGYLGSAFDDLQFSGETTTRLHLQVPVDDPDKIDVKVQTALKQSSLRLLERDIYFSGINGQLSYTTRQGLTSDSLQGQLFGEAVNAQITTEGTDTQVHLQGAVSSVNLDHLAGITLSDRLTGKSQAQVDMTFCAESSRCPRMEIRSDLVGTAVDLPLVLAKPAEESRSLYLDIYPENSRLSFHYDQLLQGVMDLSAELRGQVLLGQGVPVLPQTARLEVSGELAGLSAQGYIQPPALVSEGEWIARFDYLHLPSADAESESSVPLLQSGSDQMLSVDTSELPRLDLQIDDLRLGQRALGRWQLRMQPQAQQVTFEDIQGELLDFSVSGRAHWQAGAHPATDLTLNLSGADLADVLELWGQGRPLETTRLVSSAQLTWPGAPWQFSVAELDGFFSFQAEEGRIIESGSGANLLRVFGLLNLNTLSRRLRLDFSDLLQRGLVFDELKASYDLNRGLASTREPFMLTGPSASMEITGNVNLNTQQLNKTIKVSVPLSSNLTLGAVLLGAPQVAGAIFIFDKIMGDRIEKMTRIAYTLTGHWDDPQLNLLNANEG
ncbi:YhdP family protein [Nitrincola sp.]|uniref:YhdP family phospholipid transporter n=1 Tax=Nitrincola sp. TaxID=1926584 RepID=UPI003A9100FC